MSNFIIVIAGGVLAFVATVGAEKEGKWFVATFLFVIGLFGALFSAKQYERFRFHMKAAGKYRIELEKALAVGNLSEIRSKAELENKSEFPLLSKFRLHLFWTLLHVLIAFLGLTLAFVLIRK